MRSCCAAITKSAIAPPQCSRAAESDLPNLQRPRPQHPCLLILGHIRRRGPLVLRNLLLPQPDHRISLPGSTAASGSISNGYNIILVGAVGIGVVRVLSLAIKAGSASRAVWVFDIVGVGGLKLGFFIVEGGLGGFEVIAMGGFR